MKVTIIDDDETDIEYCKILIKKNFDFITAITTYNNPKTGLLDINESCTDLLILDMEMPEISGLDFLKKMKAPNTEVVFCTSHDKFAIEGYKNFAIGFLLKPYSEENFIAVLTKAFKYIQSNKNSGNKKDVNNLISEDKIISIPTQGCTYYASATEIIRIESVNNYSKIYLTSGDIHLSSYTIKHYEQKLEGIFFFRVHRSHIINLKKAIKLFPDGTVILNTGDKIPVARRRRPELMSAFSGLEH